MHGQQEHTYCCAQLGLAKAKELAKAPEFESNFGSSGHIWACQGSMLCRTYLSGRHGTMYQNVQLTIHVRHGVGLA